MLINGIATQATSSQSSCIGTIAQFTVDVADLNNNLDIVSPNVTLNNLNWNFEIRRNGDFISLLLHSSTDNVSQWSCDAQATFKVFSQHNSKYAIEKKMSKRTFSNRNSTYEIDEPIAFSNFLNNFVVDNQTTFQIELFTCNSKTNTSTAFQQIYSRIHIILDNVSQLNEIVSSQVVVRDIRWNIRIQRRQTVVDIFLEAEEDDLDISSNYNVTATFKLLTYDNSDKAVIKSFNHAYRWGSTKGGFDSFVYFSFLMDKNNKLVFDDRSHLLVEFKVEEPQSLWDFENTL